MGLQRPTFFTRPVASMPSTAATAFGKQQVEKIDGEILGCAAATFDVFAIEELRKVAQDNNKWADTSDDAAEQRTLDSVRAELDKAWAPQLFLWQKTRTIWKRNWIA